MKTVKEERANLFFGPVTSEAFAKRLIEIIGKTLIVIAAFDYILAMLFVEVHMVNAILISFMAFWLHATQSRVAAITLLFFAAFASFTVTVNLYLGVAYPVNVALAYAVFLIAIRAVQATFELTRYRTS